MKFTLYFTGPGCLEELKKAFPDTWEKEVVEAKRRLRILQKFYKTDIPGACNKFTAHSRCAARNTLIIAAAWIMMQELAQENLKEADVQLADQMEALKASNWPVTDKEVIEAFYLSKMVKQKRIGSSLALLTVERLPGRVDFKSQIL